jgi:hypothetical protein
MDLHGGHKGCPAPLKSPCRPEPLPLETSSTPSQSACDDWQQREDSGRRVLLRLLKLELRFISFKEIAEFFRRIE